jgi:hypothetical protein
MQGYRVQILGRYSRWENMGIYGDRESAEFYINRIGQPGKPRAKYRIVEEIYVG